MRSQGSKHNKRSSYPAQLAQQSLADGQNSQTRAALSEGLHKSSGYLWLRRIASTSTSQQQKWEHLPSFTSEKIAANGFRRVDGETELVRYLSCCFRCVVVVLLLLLLLLLTPVYTNAKHRTFAE